MALAKPAPRPETAADPRTRENGMVNQFARRVLGVFHRRSVLRDHSGRLAHRLGKSARIVLHIGAEILRVRVLGCRLSRALLGRGCFWSVKRSISGSGGITCGVELRIILRTRGQVRISRRSCSASVAFKYSSVSVASEPSAAWSDSFDSPRGAQTTAGQCPRPVDGLNACTDDDGKSRRHAVLRHQK